ncbi:two-component hybrid sensor and regulator [Scytonema sp. HK-05]|uniref:hybrid sensor histidine kinase/response regulator n=1 Tax=Scytonema sp. HK-05 TaxID=1137095 RepID=UPI000935989F|nr:PAS domain S-box protein [Scytonema sp. HK-05]OKH58903.1 hybrid sensor histidine kinase/response regulator [Scytonema sp. HK-05]BAY47140.1 two-component hybrid sensor and regulator [Scytonema sp. HK-05]
MSPYLRVLIVEDSEDDTLLVLRELRRGGYTVDYVRVDTPAAMQAVLDQQSWDIVIADYNMPAFSAPEALKLLQSRKLDLPFIIVSGTIGEEIAVAAMKAGAHDYLIKGNLARLVPAVERELREAQERHKRHSAERALQESEERFRQLAENIIEMVFWMSDPGERQRLYVSPAYENIWGRSRESLYANFMEWLEAIHPQDRQHIETVFFEQSLAGTYDEEYRIIRPDGSLRWIRDRGFPIRDKSGEPYRVVGIAEDISDRKLAEQQIREQAALLDVATDAIFVQDLEQHLLFWNKGAERLYGWEAAEVLGRSAESLVYKSEETLPPFEAIQTILAAEGKWQGELQQVTKDGKKIIVESRWTLVRDVAGNSKSILIVNTDITAKKQLEAQFLRTQRLESLGTLASGIAHDFNNILTPILAIAQLLPLKFPKLDENTQELLRMLEGSAKRGGDLVTQILSFSRRGVEGSRTIVQTKHLLLDVAQIAQRTFPKSIETQTNIAPNLWTVFADATQLHQVLMNLTVNARDAMPDGGILEISAENLWVDESYARMHVDAEVGSYIVITITDTGCGIPPEIMDRIFDPFFTTKEVGKGTGLGLSTVIGIIKSHCGFVNVYSEMGKGSRFQVYLPSSQLTETPAATDVELPNGHGELILVVDDEVTICQITKSTLESHNYKVLTASDGIEALALYAQYKDEISVVLIDLMMPGIDGSTTILTLQRMNPHVQIIAMSGLMSNWTTAQKRSFGIQYFLSKPFTAQALLSTLREVRDS